MIIDTRKYHLNLNEYESQTTPFKIVAHIYIYTYTLFYIYTFCVYRKMIKMERVQKLTYRF